MTSVPTDAPPRARVFSRVLLLAPLPRLRTISLQTNPHALADRTQAQSNAFYATHCLGGHKHSYCSQATQ